MNADVWLPNCRHLTRPEIIRSMAVRAEQLGYDSVWVSDHVVVPHANVVNFGETIFDPLVTLGVVAGATRRIRLGTSAQELQTPSPLDKLGFERRGLTEYKGVQATYHVLTRQAWRARA